MIDPSSVHVTSFVVSAFTVPGTFSVFPQILHVNAATQTLFPSSSVLHVYTGSLYWCPDDFTTSLYVSGFVYVLPPNSQDAV